MNLPTSHSLRVSGIGALHLHTIVRRSELLNPTTPERQAPRKPNSLIRAASQWIYFAVTYVHARMHVPTANARVYVATANAHVYVANSRSFWTRQQPRSAQPNA